MASAYSQLPEEAKEKRRAANRRWREAHLDQAREATKAWQLRTKREPGEPSAYSKLPERRKQQLRKIQKRYRERHPEKVKERAKRWYWRDPDDRRERVFRWTYGMRFADYDALLQKQGGACAICGSAENKIKNKTARPLRLDHDHSGNFPRGILCHRCNLGLGYFGDDPKRLQCAATYLIERRWRTIIEA